MSSTRTRTRARVVKKSRARPKPKVRRAKKAEPDLSTGRGTRWLSIWEARERKFTELFGPSQPKDKALSAEGESISPREAQECGWCVLQFPPRLARMNWIYATHGLSQMPLAARHGVAGVELLIYWRQRDKTPARILAQAARALLSSAAAFEPGHIVPVEAALPAPGVFKQCVACQPDETIPARIAFPGGSLNPLMLISITDTEMDFAQKVNPELAHGGHVLLEALTTGGVFPISDPNRMCMSRRRDFHRLWENAFRIVREKRAR
jgi:hypothetical protein